MDFSSAVIDAEWTDTPAASRSLPSDVSSRLKFQPANDEIVVGVDIGGTKAHVAGWSASGIIEYRMEVAARGDESLVNFVLQAIDKCVGDKKLLGLAMGVPGVVDQQDGSLDLSPNLPGWESINIAETFSSLLKVPVVVENDVHLAAYGEFIWRGTKDMAFIAIGTGIGSGVVINGEIVHGITGASGEVYDVPIPGADPNQLRPVEDIACGPGLENLYADIVGRPLSPPEILQRIDSDPAARRALNIFGQSVAILVSAIHGILDPEIVAIGGGLGVQDEILDSINTHLRSFKRRAIQVKPSLLQSRASTLGALARATELAQSAR